MSELGGMEGFSPEEGISGAPEQLSDDAKAKFTANAAAIKQIRKEEKQSKKRDDQVAKAIIQFLGDEKYSHLFILISKLVGRNCPSIFILAVLSLINESCYKEVEKYLQKSLDETERSLIDKQTNLMKNDELDDAANQDLVEWVTRMQLVLSVDPNKILLRLMLDEKNIDGSVLQLTTFVLQDFLDRQQKKVAFEKVQPLTANILQSVFEPFMSDARKRLLENKPQATEDDEEED